MGLYSAKISISGSSSAAFGSSEGLSVGKMSPFGKGSRLDLGGGEIEIIGGSGGGGILTRFSISFSSSLAATVAKIDKGVSLDIFDRLKF